MHYPHHFAPMQPEVPIWLILLPYTFKEVLNNATLKNNVPIPVKELLKLPQGSIKWSCDSGWHYQGLQE